MTNNDKETTEGVNNGLKAGTSIDMNMIMGLASTLLKGIPINNLANLQDQLKAQLPNMAQIPAANETPISVGSSDTLAVPETPNMQANQEEMAMLLQRTEQIMSEIAELKEQVTELKRQYESLNEAVFKMAKKVRSLKY